MAINMISCVVISTYFRVAIKILVLIVFHFAVSGARAQCPRFADPGWEGPTGTDGVYLDYREEPPRVAYFSPVEGEKWRKDFALKTKEEIWGKIVRPVMAGDGIYVITYGGILMRIRTSDGNVEEKWNVMPQENRKDSVVTGFYSIVNEFLFVTIGEPAEDSKTLSFRMHCFRVNGSGRPVEVGSEKVEGVTKPVMHLGRIILVGNEIREGFPGLIKDR